MKEEEDGEGVLLSTEVVEEQKEEGLEVSKESEKK